MSERETAVSGHFVCYLNLCQSTLPLLSHSPTHWSPRFKYAATSILPLITMGRNSYRRPQVSQLVVRHPASQSVSHPSISSHLSSLIHTFFFFYFEVVMSTLMRFLCLKPLCESLLNTHTYITAYICTFSVCVCTLWGSRWDLSAKRMKKRRDDANENVVFGLI